ncbi:MAG TPA: C45 family peptidase [Flavobacterium sp.]|nr:C45 family peptidase [Flavobacterium sp.]
MEQAESKWNQVDFSEVVLMPQDVFSKSPYGNYLLKVSGTPYEIGYKTGKFTDSLYQKQERLFFDQVAQMTGSPKNQKRLLSFLRWYNRDLIHYISNEYQQELYGVSRFGSNVLDTIATPFQRTVMLHGAHDIGHAMQDLMLVGCSSVALNHTFSEDGSLWVARNFDFYVSDAFAENKIVAFIQPKKGYKYASITWPGMLGVVSGMNEKGLTVTINAGKSTIPLKAKQPVSLVAKEILQYAATIEEARKIAADKNVFVSEAIFIGSALDNRAEIIELSPKKYGTFASEEDYLICTNHFQSEVFQKDKRNNAHKKNSHSVYRYEVIDEFLEEHTVVNEEVLAELLRKTTGLNQKEIGYGNEKALNQLLAHHGVIFHPKTLRMWVSTSPYQLGVFEAYDLNQVFNSGVVPLNTKDLIPEDPFLHTQDFTNVQEYRKLLKELIPKINKQEPISLLQAKQLTTLNPEYGQAYFWAGRIAFQQEAFHEALTFFETAKSKEAATLQEQDTIEKWIAKCQKRLKKRQK